MLLSETGISTRHISAFKKKNITTTEQVMRLFPKRYHEYSVTKPLSIGMQKEDIAIQGILKSIQVTKNTTRVVMKAKVLQVETNLTLTVVWIGSYNLFRVYKEWKEKEVIVGGKIEYVSQYKCFSTMNPILFSLEPENHKRIYKENISIKGISDEALNEMLNSFRVNYPEKEIVPEDILKKYKLMDINTAISTLHFPISLDNVVKAKQRMVFSDLLYFAMQIKADARNHSRGTSYNLKSKKCINSVIKNLPYELTKDQVNSIFNLADKMMDGKRIDVLLQGDVGYGKSIVAFLLMLEIAKSGYQAVLLAPLQQLAKQHYEELKVLADEYDISIVYLDGATKFSEKNRIYKEIENGNYSLIVGTHSVFSEKLRYNKLAMIIIDEEQKFGVEQKEQLIKKAVDGCHKISMSATPMPRTITDIIYDNGCKEICNIKTKPCAKLDIKTTIFNHKIGILKFIENEIEKNHQCYSVCPLIEKNENCDRMENVSSAEEIFKEYQMYFKDKSINIEMVTGKTSIEETNEIFERFRNNETQILVSTTVIEVGINVPNATTIVINNAERFGLPTLHQLRGRVGRGSFQSYCILNSEDIENERLKIIESCSDGFEIAESDCKLRGSGNILGTEQSGYNKYIDLVMEYPNMYKKINEIAEIMLDR